jgi:DNA-binding MurR/RpiR family transcriptional regulator
MNTFTETDNVLEKITNAYESFTNGERKIASYIIDNYTSAALLSSSELARASGVSDTTVIRFAKTLGYSGFIELKRAMRSDLKSKSPPINLNFSPYEYLKSMETAPRNQVVVNYVSSLINDMTSFLQHFDYNSLDAIVDKVLRAQTIYLAGIGSDSIVARFLFIYLRKMGFPVTLIQDGDCITFESLLHLCEKDIIIMSSFPRLLNAEKIIAREAKEKKVPLITITASNVSVMMLNGDINITLTETKKTFFNSYVLPLCFCNLLLLRIYEKEPELIEKNIKEYVDRVSIAGWK